MRHVTEQVNHPPLLEEGEGDTLFRSNFIMEQGTVGQEMYVIITGDAVVVEQDGLKIGTLNSGDFFGEPVPERGSPSLVLHCSASYYTAVGLRGACFVRACSVVWCGAVRCGTLCGMGYIRTAVLSTGICDAYHTAWLHSTALRIH